MREATSETYGSRVYFSNILLSDLSFAAFCFQIYYHKNPKIPCCTFYFPLSFCVLVRSIYPIYYNLIYLFIVEKLTTSLSYRVASICSLCASTIYIVLCGSPTGSITLVSSLREIPTVAVLHHPFLFGEIPT